MVWRGDGGGRSLSAGGVMVGERPKIKGGVEAVVKLSAAHQMLEVMEKPVEMVVAKQCRSWSPRW